MLGVYTPFANPPLPHPTSPHPPSPYFTPCASASWDTPPLRTNTSENITFPTTSFAGGNNGMHLLNETFQRHWDENIGSVNVSTI